uniref:Uncharacterized protein n=1 Tax=Nicotiana tabacum TaxID=4097 RepID=A0A1S3ZY34_TOBAC|nr:PREDICTED: putative protein TPRXL [Nicotiana tabacum]
MTSSSRNRSSSKNKGKTDDASPLTYPCCEGRLPLATFGYYHSGPGSVLLGEFEMVENANTSFRIPAGAPGTVRLSIGSQPSSVDEQPTPNTTLAEAASHLSMPSASSPSSPTLPPVTSSSSPPAASIREEDVPLPQSPVHGNLGQNYAAPQRICKKRRSVTLLVSTGCNLLSQPVELANYLKPLT